MSAAQTWSAWSCTVRLVIDDARHLTAAATDLVAILDRVDRAASRFRPDSALSYANAHGGSPVAVPRILIDLVDAALSAAERSGGAVDPTIGNNVIAAGYDRDFRDLPPTGPGVDAAPAPAGWQKVKLDRRIGLLTVPRGCTLDLGATAKAYTADYAARTIFQRFGSAVLVEIGGDLAVAGDKIEGWAIQVAEREGEAGDTVMLHSGGLATSTTTIRTWTRGGQRMHHIIDPATGLSTASRWRTATVAADSALAANTASTAAIVLDHAAQTWLAEHNLAARLVGADGSISTTARWPVRETVDYR